MKKEEGNLRLFPNPSTSSSLNSCWLPTTIGEIQHDQAGGQKGIGGRLWHDTRPRAGIAGRLWGPWRPYRPRRETTEVDSGSSAAIGRNHGTSLPRIPSTFIGSRDI